VTKERLDEALVAHGFLPSRSRARDAVLRSGVNVNGVAARKPSQMVGEGDVLELHDPASAYVSRAALKLIHALDHFGIVVAGRLCLDIGASTGGFTQVLLERGAAHVTAVDVGHGQMEQALSADPRVTLVENLNARDITRAHMPEGISLVVCDVSFISLRLALPAVMSLAASGTQLVALVKPQFEVGRDGLGKGGVVRDEALLSKACTDVSAFLQQQGWAVQEIEPSPIAGGDGNREFLLAAVNS
jgi:23S rRNA (cytidine1920-2'-O)/16S rRNA (cytidine1409-2'-O)-methyltransferase